MPSLEVVPFGPLPAWVEEAMSRESVLVICATSLDRMVAIASGGARSWASLVGESLARRAANGTAGGGGFDGITCRGHAAAVVAEAAGGGLPPRARQKACTRATALSSCGE